MRPSSVNCGASFPLKQSKKTRRDSNKKLTIPTSFLKKYNHFYESKTNKR
jgi:hypothetical protein